MIFSNIIYIAWTFFVPKQLVIASVDEENRYSHVELRTLFWDFILSFKWNLDCQIYPRFRLVIPSSSPYFTSDHVQSAQRYADRSYPFLFSVVNPTTPILKKKGSQLVQPNHTPLTHSLYSSAAASGWSIGTDWFACMLVVWLFFFFCSFDER